MIYKLSATQENELLNSPETGMGYQVIRAIKQGFYSSKDYLVLNSEVVIELNEAVNENVRKVVNQGILAFKASASMINLKIVSVLSETQFRNTFNESKIDKLQGAIDNQIENANGKEVFVRLSAFDDDRRIDKSNKCLRPGSFTTTEVDYLNCKFLKFNPIERYALPNNDEIKFAFHIQPLKSDSLQRGIVQPAYGKQGGGVEAYFETGTANGTFLKQTPY